MAGNFARGFMSTFGPTVQATANRRDDMFKTFYKQFTDKQEAYQANQVKDAKITNQAKLLAQDLGLPEGAWDWVRKRLADGYSLEQVKEAAERQKFGPTDMAPGQTNEAAPSAMETQEQMRQAGLSMPAPQGAIAPPDASVSPSQPRTGGIPQAIVAGVERMKKGFQDRDMDLMMKRMEQTTGLPREQIEIIMAQNPAAITPMGDPSKQQTQTAQTYTVEPRNMATEYTPEEQKLFIDTINKLAKPIEELDVKQRAGEDMLRTANNMVKIIGSDQGTGVLAPLVGDFAQFVTGTEQTIKGFIGLRDGQQSGFVPEQSNAMNQKLREIESKGGKISDDLLNTAISVTEKEIAAFEASVGPLQNIRDLSQAKTLFEMQTRLLAYQIAATYDQQGRSLSEVERQMFEDIASSGNSPQKFYQNISVLLDGELSKIDRQRESVQNSIYARGFKQATKKDLNLDIGGGPIREYMQNTYPELDNLIRQYGTVDKLPEGEAKETSPQTKIPEGYTFVEKTDKGQTVVRDASGNQFVLGE